MVKKAEKILKDVLEDIRPPKQEKEEVEEEISSFISRLNKGLKDAKALLGGSGAKSTWISGTREADIFVQFNYEKYKDKSDKLSDMLEKKLKKISRKIDRLHGSRDYFQIKKKDFVFEIVPILKIEKAEDAKNITDVSPLHAKWVNKHKKLADEMRLTKQFCKAQKVYGAESYIKGFSGYMCEILTIHYGGFLKLAKAACKWEPKTVIDTERHHKNKRDVLFNINKSKQQGPMVLIDPVQKNRNAAAALDQEKYEKFILACKEFLKNPSKKFFEKREISIEELKDISGKDKLAVVKASPLDGKEDIVGSKLLKVSEFLKKGIKDRGFKIYHSGWRWDKDKEALFWFIIDQKKLPEHEIKEGPPLDMEEHVKNFKKQYKGNTFVKKGKIFAEIKREYREPEKLVKTLIKKKYVREKVGSISIV